MALISCPACSKPVSEQAPTCPTCGHPIGVALAVHAQQSSAGHPLQSTGSFPIGRVLSWATSILVVLSCCLLTSCLLFTVPGKVVLHAVGASLGLVSEESPLPVILEHKLKKGPNWEMLHLDIQNTGAPGDITFFATQGEKRVTNRINMARGQRQNVVLELVGFKAEPFNFGARPTQKTN